jgi:hypothetical protein
MKGKRKRMRKMIRDACDSDRPWIEAAWELAQNGVPHNLIMWESNEYGKSKLLQTKP